MNLINNTWLLHTYQMNSRMGGVNPEAGLEISSSLHEMLQCMDQGTEESCRRFAELFTETAELHIPLVKVGAE